MKAFHSKLHGGYEDCKTTATSGDHGSTATWAMVGAVADDMAFRMVMVWQPKCGKKSNNLMQLQTNGPKSTFQKWLTNLKIFKHIPTCIFDFTSVDIRCETIF